jgi:DNA-binding CsgD family transcriptional regulator
MVPDSDLFERAAGLVEILFEAPGDPRAWERLLAALAHSLSKGAVPMMLGPITDDDSPPFLLGHGMGLRRLSHADLQPDGDHPPPERAMVGQIFEIPPASDAFARTRLFQNVFAKEGLAPGPGLLAVLARDGRPITGGLMVLSRDPSWSPTADDRALLEMLAPYLIRGVMLGLRLNERRSSIDALLGVFDSLVLGVILLDAHGNVAFANQSAADLLGTNAGLTRAARGQAAEQCKRTEALRAFIRREMGGTTGVLSYPHPDDGRPLYITSTPLSWGGAKVLPDAHFATALFLGDPGSAAAGAANALGRLYGLTPAEERLALALASGRTLAESSRALGIRLSTARGVLRAVFEKTDTNRQASLVRLILTAVGQVRRESPRG